MINMEITVQQYYYKVAKLNSYNSEYCSVVIYCTIREKDNLKYNFHLRMLADSGAILFIYFLFLINISNDSLFTG